MLLIFHFLIAFIFIKDLVLNITTGIRVGYGVLSLVMKSV
jgi:hypothetical protein